MSKSEREHVDKRVEQGSGESSGAGTEPAEEIAPAKNAEVYLALLRQAGHRITEQRQKICRYLAATEQHPTPLQVYTALRQHDPDISRATVYNTLNTLQGLGAIVEINLGTNHTHYDTNPQPHLNLICLRCHTIEDCHEELPTADLVAEISARHGFAPVATKIDVLGICRRCR